MRTTRELKLAIAILAHNTTTSKHHHRVVSSTYLFTTWQTAAEGKFIENLRSGISRPALLNHFDELVNQSDHDELLPESGRVKEILTAHPLTDGSVRKLVRGAPFKKLIKASLKSSRPQSVSPVQSRVLPSERGWRIYKHIKGPIRQPLGKPRFMRGFQEAKRRSRNPAIPLINPSSPIMKMSPRDKLLPEPKAGDVVKVKPVQAPPQKPDNFTRHIVHFGTDRLLSIDEDGDVSFGSERGSDKVNYGFATVSVPHAHEEGKLERPVTKWKFWRDTREDPNEHIVIHKLMPLDADDWARNASLSEGEGLLFIHGYNVDFDEALWRATQISHDLKFNGLKLCYSWASKGNVLDYPSDEATVDWSQKHLREFLTHVTTNLGLSRLHIIAHSMGNRALLGVLETWKHTEGMTPISQIVLAAPDIDTGRFRQIAEVFNQFEQVTLYASRKDRAIRLSQKLRSLGRAGDASPPIVMDALSTVDVTSAGAEMFGLGHGYFAGASKVFRDLYYIIKNRLKPDDRAGVRKSVEGHFILS